MDSHHTYLCQFWYGHQIHSLEDFLGGQASDFALMGSASLLGLRVRIYLHATLKLTRTLLTVRSPFLPRHPIGSNANLVVQEY